MKKPNALEFDEIAVTEAARIAFNFDYNNFTSGAEWQHSQDKIIIDKLLQVIREQREVIEDCLTTIAEECPK